MTKIELEIPDGFIGIVKKLEGQYIVDIVNEYDYLKKIFIQELNGSILNIDNENNITNYIKNGDIIFSYDSVSNVLWCNEVKIWHQFEKVIVDSNSDENLYNIIKRTAEDVLKIKDIKLGRINFEKNKFISQQDNNKEADKKNSQDDYYVEKKENNFHYNSRNLNMVSIKYF